MKMWLYPLWVIMDVLVGLATISLWIAAPEYQTLNISLSIFTFTLALLLAFIKWTDIKIFIKSSYFKHVVYHSINVILVFGILALLNYIGFKNYQEFDFSKGKRNSLTGQSKQVIKMIKTPLLMTVFAKREEWHQMLNLLKLYEANSKLIKISAIDTDVRPDLVKENGITQNGTVVINYQNKETKFLLQDELSVTNALLKSLREDKIIIYNVTGHQELSCENKEQEGMSILCNRLVTQNYEIQKLDLTSVKEVPQNASALIIAGPTSSFLQHEISILQLYLTRGGSLLLALAPAFKSDFYQGFEQLTSPYGLKIGNDLVVDRLSTVQGSESATIPIVTKYDMGHPITNGFDLRTVFPLSSSVRKVEGNDSANLLAFTTPFPGSWAESDLKGVGKGKAQYDEKHDFKGPVALMGVGERVGVDAPKDSRLILLGSPSFLINAYQGQTGNSTLFLNAVSWMVSDEGIISLNRPGIEESPVILSSQHIQMIFVISILVVPIVFFGAAIFVYRRRRLL